MPPRARARHRVSSSQALAVLRLGLFAFGSSAVPQSITTGAAADATRLQQMLPDERCAHHGQSTGDLCDEGGTLGAEG
jgi:hypothetical protein